MLDFFEARRRVVSAASRLGQESALLAHVAGRVLAESIHAAVQLPPFDYSAMDGYALRSTDVNGSPPWELPVAGECRAGGTPAPLPRGSAFRIFTGGVMPEGADTVVMQENVDRVGDSIRSDQLVRAGLNVRRAGEDLALGSLAAAEGTRLTPFHLGLLASLDRTAVLVARKPRIWVVPTGDELRQPGSPARPGSIPESNGPVLAALAEGAGAEASLMPCASDNLETVTRTFRDALARCDVLVTVGGVSAGDYDLVRPALEAAGARIEFWKVAIKPGKPFAFGRADHAFVLALPGNPVSAQVTFALFGIPLLRALQGDLNPLPDTIEVTLESELHQKPGRLGIYRATLSGRQARVESNSASGSVISLSRADALLFVPEHLDKCEAGSSLSAIRLREL